MHMNDEVVSGWLSGEDCGDNPAGPLYMEGRAETEAMFIPTILTTNGTTCSGSGGCACC